MHRNQPKKSLYNDNDDDSDLEMLSISSGDDEDNSVNDRDVVSNNNRSIRNKSRDAGKDDNDDRWNGEEPSVWKHVDESELGRRVREMREARGLPVAQKFERKPSIVKKGLYNLQSFPRGTECVDPLGLGIIDNRRLRLIKEYTTSSPSKDKDNLDTNLREKLMYFSEKFDPKSFLSRVHQDTTAADLKAGAFALKTDRKGRTQQRKQLVKENFDCFVSCKSTIDDIESKLTRIEDNFEGSGTSHLLSCIRGVSSVANRAFAPLFERQAQAEKIRSVQGMLQRFHTLFNLPSAIRGSISKGEYDLAVREYRKAKSIVLPSHVEILKRVLEEVEKVMHEFKGMLYRSMEDPNIDLTYLQKIVRLLVELEPDSDPVWHYLNMQNQRIRGLLEQCTFDHDTRMENLQNKVHEKALADAKWRQITQHNSDHVDSLLVTLTGEELDVLRGKYICRLTAVLVHHIPALWKVALSVFRGKLAKSSQVSAEPSVNASANIPEEKVGGGRYSTRSLDDVAGIIHSTVSVYESKVHSTFNDFEESNILCPYMSDAIKNISKACQAFEAKESAPSVAVAALRTLQSKVTKVYILRLCQWMSASSEETLKTESWVPMSVLERNKSLYTISSLPLAFRSVMVSAMDQINSMIHSLRSEATKSEDKFVQCQEIQESVRLAFLNCLRDFSGLLKNIGDKLSKKRSEKDGLHFQNGYFLDPEEKLFDPLPGSIVDPHKKLLMVLSNIGYCKDDLSRELYNKYKHIWLQSRGNDEDSDMQKLVMSFSGLEEKVLVQYTFAKANCIRTAATNYLLDAGVQWGGAPAVKGVRDAAVELLHTLVAVHAQVFVGCKPLLDKILGILIEGLTDELLNLFHENKEKDFMLLDPNGFCQLMLELEYFETILNPFLTPEACKSLKSLQDDLLDKASESVPEANETPSHRRRVTRGSDDVFADERQQGMTVSPDDLIALAQQYSSELLQSELERTRLNTACFVESIELDMVSESAKAAYSSFTSMESPNRSFKSTQPIVASPGYPTQRRRL